MFRAAHIGTKLGFNFAKSMLGFDAEDPSQLMQQFGGFYSKAAQMTKMQTPDDSVFNECKPIEKEELDKRCEAFCKKHSVDYKQVRFIASGSIGGVYRAPYETKDGKTRRIAVKMKYPGIRERWEADISAIGKVGGIGSMIGYDVKEIKQQLITAMNIELDYLAERKNLSFIRNAWNKDKKKTLKVLIPFTYPKMCTNDTIVMQYIRGQSLVNFLKKCTMEEKVAKCREIFEFAYGTMWKGKVFADCHWGNFMVTSDKRLVVIDFGNVIDMPKKLAVANHTLFKETSKILTWGDQFAKIYPQAGDEKSKRIFYDLFSTLYPYLYGRNESQYDAKTMETINSKFKLCKVIDGGVMMIKMIVMLFNIFCYLKVKMKLSDIVAKYVPG